MHLTSVSMHHFSSVKYTKIIDIKPNNPHLKTLRISSSTASSMRKLRIHLAAVKLVFVGKLVADTRLLVITLSSAKV